MWWSLVMLRCSIIRFRMLSRTWWRLIRLYGLAHTVVLTRSIESWNQAGWDHCSLISERRRRHCVSRNRPAYWMRVCIPALLGWRGRVIVHSISLRRGIVIVTRTLGILAVSVDVQRSRCVTVVTWYMIRLLWHYRSRATPVHWRRWRNFVLVFHGGLHGTRRSSVGYERIMRMIYIAMRRICVGI
jgi:hypothetical protein